MIRYNLKVAGVAKLMAVHTCPSRACYCRHPLAIRPASPSFSVLIQGLMGAEGTRARNQNSTSVLHSVAVWEAAAERAFNFCPEVSLSGWEYCRASGATAPPGSLGSAPVRV